MPHFESFKNFSQGVFFTIVVIIIILGGIWLFILSPIGNWVNSKNEAPDPPSTAYQIGIHNTGQILYTDKYTIVPSPGNPNLQEYTLYGYYSLEENKYVYHEGDLTMDEYYWGNIEPRGR